VPGRLCAPIPDPQNRPPEYPERARRQRQQGDVLLHLVIDVDGEVARVSVARSSGTELLDEAAAHAASSWRFAPASQDGVALSSEVDVPVGFVLR
jgi:protein TonB